MDPIPEGAACHVPDCESPPVEWVPASIDLMTADGRVVRTIEADIVLCDEHLKEPR